MIIRWLIAQRQKLVEYFDRNPEEPRDEQARDLYLQAILLFARELDFRILWAEALIEVNELSKSLILIRTIFRLLQDKKSENILTKFSFPIEYTNTFQETVDSLLNYDLNPIDLENSADKKQHYQLKCIIAVIRVLHRLRKPEFEKEFLYYIQNLIEDHKDSKIQMIGWFDLSRYFREINEYKREFEFLMKAQSTFMLI